MASMAFTGIRPGTFASPSSELWLENRKQASSPRRRSASDVNSTTRSTAPVNSNRNRFTKAAEETNYFQETLHPFKPLRHPRNKSDRRTVGCQEIASF